MVADTHAVVSDTHTVVPDTQTVVTTIEKRVADIHRSVLSTGQEGTSGKNLSVGVTRPPPSTKFLPSPRLKPG